MAKSTVSKGFARFAKKTTSGEYDEARKAERQARGIPFDVGTTGTGVVSQIICDEAGEDDDKHPYIAVELSVVTPEAGAGKTLRGGGLRWDIRDSSKPGSDWTAEKAFGAALGMLEDLGLPEEISKGYSDFQECLDWFDEEERAVSWEIQPNNYKNRAGEDVKGKQIRAYALTPEGEGGSADDGEKQEASPDADYCTYRGVKHEVVSFQDGVYTLKNMNNGRTRSNVQESEVKFEG